MKHSFHLALLALAVTSSFAAPRQEEEEPTRRMRHAPELRAPVAETAAPASNAAMALAATPAAGAVISRSSGNTPNLSDFGPAFANHPYKGGYNESRADRMFLDTFRPTCASGQRPTAATFKITVKKLQSGASNDALAFWDAPPTPVFNTYLWSPTDPDGMVKTLTFNLASLPAVSQPNGPVINSPAGGDGRSLLADGDFSFSVQDDTAVTQAVLEYACTGDPTGEGVRKGMTWGVYPDHPVTGVATVACQGTPGPDCNAYQGDTPGTAVLPVLCFKAAGQPLPLSHAGHFSARHWSGGIVATTPPVSPIAAGLTTLTAVNAYCAQQFGQGWGVAEFHMGANHGWAFSAYGHVGPAGSSRFWVDINDQNANVWTRP